LRRCLPPRDNDSHQQNSLGFRVFEEQGSQESVYFARAKPDSMDTYCLVAGESLVILEIFLYTFFMFIVKFNVLKLKSGIYERVLSPIFKALW
jgi:hypothetical protein